MANSSTKPGKLQPLLDALADSALGVSDEEIISDIQEAGKDSDKLVSTIKQLMNAAIDDSRQKKLRQAQAAYQNWRSSSQTRTTRIPADPVEQRALLNNIISSRKTLPEGFTMAFRNHKHMSDTDVASTLADLEELGLLDQDFDDQ